VIAGIICGRTGLFTKSSVVSVVPRAWLEEMLAKVETYIPTFQVVLNPSSVTGVQPHARSWAS